MENIAWVVFSFDGYSDLWDTQFTLLDRYCYDISMKRYLVTQNLDFHWNKLNILHTELNNDWCSRAIEALNKVDEDYVIFLLDDFVVTKKIDLEKLEQVYRNIINKNILYYKFKTRFFSLKYSKEERIDKYTYSIDEKRKYGISLQPSIWNKKYFIRLLMLNLGGTPWDFEKFFNNDINFFYTYDKMKHIFDSRNILNIEQTVIQGKYFPYAKRIFKKNNISVDFANRSFYPTFRYLIFIIKSILRRFFTKGTKK